MARISQFRRGDYPLASWGKLSHEWPRGISGLAFALGDDTPDSIRLYVPRLAAAMHALMLYDTGLMYGALDHKPFAAHVWENRLATEFNMQAKKYLGFVPVVHEAEGADVIFAHMAGAANHTDANRIWGRMQTAINRARTATGTPTPADPNAGAPRPWESAAPPPPPANGGRAPTPPAPAGRGSIWELLAGAGLVIGGIVLL